ncbi:centromere kinetochore component CENP-T-domain-containing protein [Corynascus similis CBS 632.67]
MARESRPPDATPTRRASSAEPLASITRRSIFQTPGNQTPSVPRLQGLSASGRKIAPPTATPHARAAFRTIDSRRAAILTPHRARRKSLREVRDSPRDFLLSLGRVLARNTEVITTSSSSSPGGEAGRGPGSDGAGNDTTLSTANVGDDDDDEELPKRPRLSLPIDEEDDDDSDDLQPHRSVVFDENDNFTMQSIEMPRRAYSEQPGGRLSMGSMRMSDYFNTNDMLHSEDIGVDSGFFPPTAVLDEGNITMGVQDLSSPERLDSDLARRGLGRESDFGIEIPVGEINESTFMIAPQVEDSPDRPSPGDVELVYDDYAPLVDQRSDDFDDADLGDVPALEEEPMNDPTAALDEQTELESALAKRATVRELGKKPIKVSKYGIEYPSLPPAVVKRLAQNFAKASGAKGKITADAMKAIMQASDWFFEQLGDDLQAYAKHAGRKTIDESDVLTLMKRQRQINPNTTPFALAQRHLPRELLQELRMPPPVVPKKRRKGKGEGDDEIT